MSVSDIGSAALAAQIAKARQSAADWSQLNVGQNLTLRILNQIARDRYIATSGGERHVVESKVSLKVGETVRATVTTVGDRVELKYLGSEQADVSASEELAESSDGAAGDIVNELQEKFGLSLTQQEQRTVQTMALGAAKPEMMALGGLYLSKLAQQVDPDAMRALYEARAWTEYVTGSTAGTANDISQIINAVQRNEMPAVQALAKLLGDAVEQSKNSAASVEVGEADVSLAMSLENLNDKNSRDLTDERDAATRLQELARQLLNIQDMGSLAYRFGSLPVLVSDQLIELDMVLFHEHAPVSRPQGLKRLVMSLRTETLGRIEIVAQSLDTRLSLSISADSTQSTGLLANHVDEVKDLIGRLGWSVDSVAYRVTHEPARAADQIVAHVLTSGTLDAVL
jgi:hypothetical protein